MSKIEVDVVYSPTGWKPNNLMEACLRLAYRRPGLIIAPTHSRELEEVLIPQHDLHAIEYKPEMGDTTDMRMDLCRRVAVALFGDVVTMGEVMMVSRLIEENIYRVKNAPPPPRDAHRRMARAQGVCEITATGFGPDGAINIGITP